MTEREWLACADPQKMLAFLRGKVSDRKLRLFACACCRRIWHVITGAGSRQAVELAERYADGRASPDELAHASEEAELLWGDWEFAGNVALQDSFRGHSTVWPADRDAGDCAAYCAKMAAEAVSRSIESDAAEATARMKVGTPEAVREPEESQQCGLFRDISGNPFRPTPPLPPAVLAWNDGTVRRIAEGIYEERAFDRLPVLADALLDAGCDDEALIQHCRGPGPHVRGCWAADLILGKE